VCRQAAGIAVRHELRAVGENYRDDYAPRMNWQVTMPVSKIYFERLPNSLKLGLAAFAISLIIGVPLGARTYPLQSLEAVQAPHANSAAPTGEDRSG
jgi:hypothetical protein